jgi:hypothetical protein
VKIIFLDIDGVVATQRSYDKQNTAWFGVSNESKIVKLRAVKRAREAYIPDLNLENWPFDEVAVSLLHRIVCDNEDVKIVVSSTWRNGQTVESLEQIFQYKGLHIPIVGFTPRLNEDRGIEILKWIEEFGDLHDVTHWCVLDDMGNSIRRYVGDKLIQTDPNVGLNEPEFGMICKLLELNK